MSLIKYLLLFIVVAVTAPVNAAVLIHTDVEIGAAGCSIVADKKDEKKDGSKEEEEEPDCE